MKSIKTIIRSKKLKVNGTAPIYFQYSYDRLKRTLLKTGKYIKPSFWDDENEIVRRSHPDEKAMNAFLDSQRFLFTLVLLKGINILITIWHLFD